MTLCMSIHKINITLLSVIMTCAYAIEGFISSLTLSDTAYVINSFVIKLLIKSISLGKRFSFEVVKNLYWWWGIVV